MGKGGDGLEHIAEGKRRLLCNVRGSGKVGVRDRDVGR